MKSVWWYVEWRVYLTPPVLASVLAFVGGVFLLHAPCWYVSRLGLLGSFSYTHRHEICAFVRPRRSVVGTFSYTPRAGNCLVFRRAGSLSDTPLAVIFLVVRLVGNFSYTPRASMSCLPFV